MIITVNISWVRDSQRLQFEVNQSYKTTLAYDTESVAATFWNPVTS